VWHWYSIDQAIAAALFSRKSKQLEDAHPAPSQEEQERGLQWSEAGTQEHRSCVVASLLAAIAFLEASINELFASASHPNLEGGGILPEEKQAALTATEEMLSKNPLLDRYRLALHLRQERPFDIGAQPYQDAALVVRLRNELVHYKPRWRPGGTRAAPERHPGGTTGGTPASGVDESNLTKALSGKGFALNPFTSSGNPFFPDQCLSHGCASWAWSASLGFADDFFDRINIQHVYNHVDDPPRRSIQNEYKASQPNQQVARSTSSSWLSSLTK
jgi:hypothetical protein